MSNVSQGYRPDIDGLRGIAVFCVVMFHAGLAGFSGGFVGVDVFFVISGYLICKIIQREIEERRFSFAKFYVRRAKRILPALFFMLLVSCALTMLVLTTAEMQDFSKSAVATICAFSNIYFWKSANYFSGSAELKPLMMTWSLSVEEQFYLFFPPLLLVLRRLKWRTEIILVMLCAASLAASAWMTSHKPTGAFFLLPARAWELGAGALVAQNALSVVIDRVRPGWLMEVLGAIGLFAVVGSVTYFDAATPFPGTAAALPVLGAAMLIVSQGTMVNRYILSNKMLVFVGLVSYSWYLWHWPFMSFARLVADRPISVVTALTLAALSFLVAILSWRYVEQPFRTTRRGVSKTLWRYGAATGAMLAIATGLMAGHGWQVRLPGSFLVIERSGAVPQNPCLASYGQSAPNFNIACVATAAGEKAALIGDSHAAALAPGLRTLAARYGFGYTEMTKSSCPVLEGVTRRMPNHPEHERECTAFSQVALARLRNDATIKVVFIAGYWSAPFAEETLGQRFAASARPSELVTPEQSRQYLRLGMEATMKSLTASGKKIVLLKDVPVFNFDPVRSIAADRIPVRKLAAGVIGMVPAGDGLTAGFSELANRGEIANIYIDLLAKKYPQITVIDPAAVLCHHGRCSYAGNGNLYYIDSQHLSEAGSVVALRQEAISRLMADRGATVVAGMPLPAL